MNSIQTLSLIYEILVGSFSLFLIILFLVRFYNYTLKKKHRSRFSDVQGNLYSKVLKVLFGMCMLVILINVLPYTYIGSSFRNVVSFYINHLMAFSAIALTIQEIYLSFSISDNLLNTKKRKITLSILLILLIPLTVYTTIYIPDFFEYPEEDECYIIDLPVKGKWLAGHAGGNEIVNYHFMVKSQAYAMDIVRVNDKGDFYTGEGKDLSDFPTFGSEVFSPVSGEVVLIVDNLPNENITLTPHNYENPAGNHVVIEFEVNRYVFLAHLDSNSVVVHEGDVVSSGDLIGKAGNSGNTSWPHLHMHIQDLPYIDNKEAVGFPYRFKEFIRKRMFFTKEVEKAFLIRNDVFWTNDK